jgi:hypothetical protein
MHFSGKMLPQSELNAKYYYHGNDEYYIREQLKKQHRTLDGQKDMLYLHGTGARGLL